MIFKRIHSFHSFSIGKESSQLKNELKLRSRHCPDGDIMPRKKKCFGRGRPPVEEAFHPVITIKINENINFNINCKLVSGYSSDDNGWTDGHWCGWGSFDDVCSFCTHHKHRFTHPFMDESLWDLHVPRRTQTIWKSWADPQCWARDSHLSASVVRGYCPAE